MKKVLAFAAVVAMVLTGCVKNEVIEPEREIDFHAVNYKAQTGRAEVDGPLAGTTYDDAEHFGAFAFHDTDAWSATDASYNPAVYMDNVEIWLDAAKWKNHTKPYFWPKTGQLSFVCYSPYAFGTGTVAATATKGVTFTGFTTTNDLSKQVDLMTMDVLKDQTKAGAEVEAAFKHILSQVVFTVAPKEDLSEYVTDLTLDKLVLKAVKSEGNYASTDETVANGSWNNVIEPIDYTFTTAQVVDYTDTTAAAVGNPAIVIPQACENYIVEVGYTITYIGGAKDVVDTGNTLKISTAKWEKGNKYTYNLQIGLGDEILFTPSISTDWTNDGVDNNIAIG